MSALLESEWRQGTVVPHELLPSGTLPSSVPADAKLIILSHDCDLVNASYEAEPFIEVFVARAKPPEHKNGVLFNGKNPRRLQFFAKENGEARLYEIDVHEKYRVKRQLLENGRRDSSIVVEEADVAAIAKWASRRYRRPSMPTAFLNRISNSVKDKLIRKLKRDGDDVVCILVALNTFQELTDDKSYRIIVWVVIHPDAGQDEAREQRAIGIVSELRKLLLHCQGIEIEDADLKTTSEVTMSDLQNLLRWDFDYLSPDDPAIES